MRKKGIADSGSERLAIGEIIGKLKRRHRSSEYISFLRHIDQTVPAQLDIHLIVDNYSADKNYRRSGSGCFGIRGFIVTLCLLAVPGETWWSGSSRP